MADFGEEEDRDTADAASEHKEAAREHEKAAEEHERAAEEHEEAARHLEEAAPEEPAADEAYDSGGSLSGEDDEPDL